MRPGYMPTPPPTSPASTVEESCRRKRFLCMSYTLSVLSSTEVSLRTFCLRSMLNLRSMSRQYSRSAACGSKSSRNSWSLHWPSRCKMSISSSSSTRVSSLTEARKPTMAATSLTFTSLEM